MKALATVTSFLIAISVCSALAPVSQAATEPAKGPPEEALKYANALSTAFEYAADAVRPSVVTIRSVKRPKLEDNNVRMFPQLPDDSPFNDDFFRRFFGPRSLRQLPPQEGVGSGVIVSEDGYILTNNHVAGDADEVTVVLGDNREFRAKVVGTDPLSDLAVIQIKATKLPAAKLGDSDGLRVGEWVIAAGNPFGLSNTITAGIVSAKGRSNVRVAEYEDFIQTDAAINPGNSGGALINLRGEVVGINTAIATRTGSNSGVGFAIPMNMAKSIMESLISTGTVSRGWMGVGVQPLDEGLAKSFGFDSTEGVLIGDVMKDGPAEKAGLKQGDIVTSVDGTKIKDMPQFRNLIASKEPGHKVKLELVRDGKPTALTVELDKRSDDKVASAAGEDKSAELGLTVQNLTPELAQRLKLSADVKGVVVTGVEPASIADRLGLATGNVVVNVQGVPVATVSEFRRQMSKHDLKAGVRILVQDGDMQRFVVLRERE